VRVQIENTESLSPAQMAQFLAASEQIEFRGQSRGDVYGWVQQILVQQGYFRLGKKQRGVVRAYLSKVTGRSLPQITRLIRQYRHSGQIQAQSYRRHRFPRHYTDADTALLAEVDRAHQWLSGPATKRILERESGVFGKLQFQRLAGISVSHLYNLRRSAAYRQRAAHYQPTRSTQISIGERRRPEPNGQPGYLRVDSVHQGDWEGVKGVYHLNAVDAVTQWEVVGCTPKISERFVEPLLAALLDQFPFPIRGFHADNGSEFINRVVAKLLSKLLVELTKSRPYHSLDNALVEGKNGAVIRKHIGWGHIPAEHAERIDRFYRQHFNPYLNYHRPCGFATVVVDARGKRKRLYPASQYLTPYEKLKSLPDAEQYLKPGLSFQQLDRWAHLASDTAWAQRMKLTKENLLRECKIESPVRPQF
jgi:transposase InsO family protein